MIHDDLVLLAARWLKRDHPVVITEMTSYAIETPDAIGFKSAWSTLVECKASRADFLADKKKKFRQQPETGMGNRRFYLCPKGMIDASELPDQWGLLYATPTGCHIVHHAIQQECNAAIESTLLLSALRRLGTVDDIKGVSVKVYTIKTRNRASLYLREDLP